MNDWRDNAACLGLTDLFYTERGENHGVAAAKAVCWTCPVQTECLTESLAKPEPEKWGIWGGYSERERRRLRRYKEARVLAFVRIGQINPTVRKAG